MKKRINKSRRKRFDLQITPSVFSSQKASFSPILALKKQSRRLAGQLRGGKKKYYCKVIFCQAEDPDGGLNEKIRYQILGEENLQKFSIDPATGQVQSAGVFYHEAGRVFGFDVKATDRDGAEDGRSSITNVFVSSFIIIFYGRRLLLYLYIINASEERKEEDPDRGSSNIFVLIKFRKFMTLRDKF